MSSSSPRRVAPEPDVPGAAAAVLREPLRSHDTLGERFKTWFAVGKVRPMNLIARLLPLEDILLDVEVSSKAELFEAIGRHMQRQHGLAKEWVVASLSRREQVGCTALGQGVAIPHARVGEIDRLKIAYLRLKSPIPFDAPDDLPVSDVLVLLAPKQATEEHLRILADATRLFVDRRFRARLAECATPLSVKHLLEAWS